MIPRVTGSLMQTVCPATASHISDTPEGRIPLSFIAFIDDACSVGIPHQTGLSYDFRHKHPRESLGSINLSAPK